MTANASSESSVKVIVHGKCPFCGKDLMKEQWKSETSRKEAQISGLCQSCQDIMFGEEK